MVSLKTDLYSIKVLNKIATVVASYPKQLVVILCFVAGNFVEAGRMGEGKGEGGGGPTPLTNYFELGKKREKRVKFFKFQIILCRTRTALGKR